MIERKEDEKGNCYVVVYGIRITLISPENQGETKEEYDGFSVRFSNNMRHNAPIEFDLKDDPRRAISTFISALSVLFSQVKKQRRT